MSVVQKVFAGFVFVIIALAVFPVIDLLAAETFVVLDGTSSLIMVNIVKVIIGMIPFLIAVSAVYEIVSPGRDFRQA